MKYLTVIFLLIQTATPTIEGVEISGIEESTLSQALRDDIQKLVGQQYNPTQAEDFTNRIQAELPGYIAATKLMPGARSETSKLVFVVVRREIERIDPAPPDTDVPESETESNINSRYTVESAEIRGLNDVNVSDELLADLQKLVGQKLNQIAIRQLQQRIESELRSRYDVSRRVTRGDNRDHVKVIFDVKKVPWIVYRPAAPQFVYHSKHAFSVGMDLDFDMDRSNRIVLGWTVRDQDQFLERFHGLRAGFQSRELFTDRLGFRLNVATYRQKWNGAVKTALSASPDALGTYRRHDAFDVSLTFAFDTRLMLEAGASVTVLDMEDASTDSVNSHAGVAALSYTRNWARDDGGSYGLEASYTVRAATHNLDSELIYTRHFWRADYGITARRKKARVAVMGGRLSGQAPLFERFTLGNSQTLRGWSKFDVAPLGADRVAHGSLELGFDPFNVFYDAGAVWNTGNPIQVRHSVGLGFGWRNLGRDRRKDDWFISIGFPIEAARIRRPLLMMGLRF